MCIAIFKTPEAILSDDVLLNSYNNNRDGCGIAFINDDGAIEVHKTMEYAPFKEMYDHFTMKYPNSPFLVHFRVATKGTVDEFNCHPFIIDTDHVFMHNGSISNAPNDPEKKMSDTQMFNEHILKCLPEDWMWNEAIADLITEYIGIGSKVVVMNAQGEFRIYNETAGHWENGVWYSNYSYKDTFSRQRYSNNPTGYNRNANSTSKYAFSTLYKRFDGIKHKWDYKEQRYRPVNSKDAFLDYTPVSKDDTDDGKVVELPRVFPCEWCNTNTSHEFIRVITINDGAGNDWELLICNHCLDNMHGWALQNYRITSNKLKEKRRVYNLNKGVRI